MTPPDRAARGAGEMRLRAIIVDDEPLARDGLQLALESEMRDRVAVSVVASCADGYAACDALRALHPDVVFLDVQMPELDGFGVLEQLEPEDVPPAIVFVTAYDAHALRAFEANALDYVLKPLVPDRLWAAVARAGRRVREARALRDAERDTSARDGDNDRDDDGDNDRGDDRDDNGDDDPLARDHPRDAYLARLIVRDARGTTVLPVSELDWIQADAYYVWLHAGGRSLLLRERMHVLESRLDPAVFFRTHRSAIVRLDRVREIRAAPAYEHTVLLTSGARVRLSRDRRARLEAALGAAPVSG